MSETAEHPRSPSSTELSPVTLGLASLGSVLATLLVSRFGIAGTIAGAALAPVVIALVKELGRRPVTTIARLPSGARAVVRRRPGVRWSLVGITAAVGFAVAVAAFTVPDLLAGESVVSERPSTFFSAGGDGGADPGSGSPADDRTRTAPEEPESITTTPPEDAPTTTAPPAAAAPPPDPAATAPAPVAPPVPAVPAEPIDPQPAEGASTAPAG